MSEENATQKIETALSRQRGVQSIEVGFRLVQALLASGAPMALKDLAAHADMSASKAHTYLTSLRRVGLVSQSAADGAYSLGPLALDLGLSVLNRESGISHGERAIRLLREDAPLQGTLFLSIWTERGPVIVLRDEGLSNVPFQIRVGFHSPIATTATGRTFLAYLPDHRTAPLLSAEFQGLSAKHRRAMEQDLDMAIEMIRESGAASVDDRTIPGFTGLAVPLFDYKEALTGVLTLIGVSGTVSTKPDGPELARMRQASVDARDEF